jgi:hypothetical protein
MLLKQQQLAAAVLLMLFTAGTPALLRCRQQTGLQMMMIVAFAGSTYASGTNRQAAG